VRAVGIRQDSLFVYQHGDSVFKPRDSVFRPQDSVFGHGDLVFKNGNFEYQNGGFVYEIAEFVLKNEDSEQGNGDFLKENEGLVREDGPGFAPARNDLATATRLLPAAQPMTMRCMDSGRLAATRETMLPLSKLTSVARRLPPKTTVSTPNVAAISIMVSAGESLTL
jgi:hypothetical protein